jgi:CheY-like chemotaxis protein
MPFRPPYPIGDRLRSAVSGELATIFSNLPGQPLPEQLRTLLDALEESTAMGVAPESLPARILIAEDYGLIGVMLEQELREAGFVVAGPFASCAAALKWLTTHTPDAAILDIELSDGPCIEVAQTLRDRNVPFLVLAGQPCDIAHHDEAFCGFPRLEKPISQRDVIETLRGLLPSHSPYQSGE